jgi:peroxiredoxin
MKKLIFSVFSMAIVCLLSFLVFGSAPQKSSSDKEITKVENFTLKDYNGKSHSLTDYKNSKVIVLMFISTKCPVSNSYNEKMKDLYDNYHSKDIEFIGINSNKAEDIDNIKEHAEDHNFKFTILKDWNNVIANRLDAQVTPEIYVLDSDFEILYHGRIDDSRGAGQAKNNDLKNALNEILSGKKVAVQKTRAMGCTIKRVDS